MEDFASMDHPTLSRPPRRPYLKKGSRKQKVGSDVKSENKTDPLTALSQRTEETFAVLQETLRRRTSSLPSCNDNPLFDTSLDQESSPSPVPRKLAGSSKMRKTSTKNYYKDYGKQEDGGMALRNTDSVLPARKGLAIATTAAVAELEKLTAYAQERIAVLERRAGALDMREERVRSKEELVEKKERELHELEIKLAREVAAWKSHVALKRKESDTENMLHQRKLEMADKEQKFQKLLQQKTKKITELQKKLEEKNQDTGQQEECKPTVDGRPFSSSWEAPASKVAETIYGPLLLWNHNAEWKPFAAALQRATEHRVQPTNSMPRSDGAVETCFSNGRREVEFPGSGLRRIMLPCGWILSLFRNGDIKGCDPHQRRQYYFFARANVESISTSDGLRYDYFVADGQLECRVPSGRALVKFRDGSFRSVSP